MPRPEIRIVYDRDSAYESRDTVKGYVSIICNKAHQVKEIKIICQGSGEVNWTVSGVQRHAEKEVYIDQTRFLLVDLSPTGMFFSPGCTDFPFEFELPGDIPSSFESWSCNVKYSCTASITPVTSSNTVATTCQCEKPFLVMGYYDISYIQGLNEPASFVGEKNLTWFFGCCSIGKIVTSFSINKKAYYLGESILIAVNIVNKTSEFINLFEARLMRMTTFKDGEGKKRSDLLSQMVCCVQNHQAQRPRSVGCARTTMKIPEKIPPTNLGAGCTIFKVSYYLKLIISSSVHENPTSSLRIFIPIKIGYTGQQTTINNDYSGSQSSFNLDAPPAYDEIMRGSGGLVTVLPSLDNDIPPPSYESHGFTY